MEERGGRLDAEAGGRRIVLWNLRRRCQMEDGVKRWIVATATEPETSELRLYADQRRISQIKVSQTKVMSVSWHIPDCYTSSACMLFVGHILKIVRLEKHPVKEISKDTMQKAGKL